MAKTFITLLFALSSITLAQSFGQNKVQYREFDWDFISSPNFDVYYYGDEIELATFTMEAANDAYEQIGKHLRWNLKKRVPIIVYHSHNEFQQNNAVGVYMSEGIGGVTELFKNRVVIPFEGDYKAFRSGTPKKFSDADAMALFNATRQGMGIKATKAAIKANAAAVGSFSKRSQRKPAWAAASRVAAR